MTDTGTNSGTRTAMVTGGSRGLGLAITKRLLADGFAVMAADVNPRALGRMDALTAEHGDMLDRVEVDITQGDQVQNAMQAVSARWGRLDVMVNNAGRNRGGGLFDTSAEDWDWVHDTNMKGTFLCSKFAAEQMREQGSGSIISISSISSAGEDKNPAYDSSKAGIIGLTRAMAHELGPLGIRANAVAPGTILTDWVQQNLPPDFLQAESAATPRGELGQPEDIAAAVSYLASDDARHVTGQVLCVSGGRWMP